MFDFAVEKFVTAFRDGENINTVWQELLADGASAALLQRAVDQAAMLTDDE